MSDEQKMDLNELATEGAKAIEEITAPSQQAESTEIPEPEKKELSEEEKAKLAKILYDIYDFKREYGKEIGISLPDGTQEDMIKKILSMPTLDPNNKESMEHYSKNADQYLYAQALREGYGMRMKNDIYRSLAEKRGSNFQQVPVFEGGAIGAMKPRFNDTGLKLTGEKALLRVRSLLGTGSQISIPLPHSGFWATFNSPNEDSILNFSNNLTNEKISLGRKSNGAALANESVYTNEAVIQFAFDNLVDTNLTTGRDGFIENLSALDLQHVAWGLACAIYQDGFDFARPIITDDPQEFKVQTGHINVTKLQQIDTSSLTDKQLRILANRNQRVSPETLKIYHDEFTRGQPREVILDDRRKVTLKVPTISQALDAGHSWVDSIVNMIDASYNMSDDKRNEKINEQSKASQMRLFDHWVDKISVLNPLDNKWVENERDDQMTIELILADWSKEDKIRKVFFDAVKQYIDDSTIGIICVTAASEKENKLALPRFEELYPIDAVAVFLLLLTRKTWVIVNRSDY